MKGSFDFRQVSLGLRISMAKSLCRKSSVVSMFACLKLAVIARIRFVYLTKSLAHETLLMQELNP